MKYTKKRNTKSCLVDARNFWSLGFQCMEYFLLDQLSRCSFIYIYRTPNFPIERREAFKNLCFNQLCCILMNLQGVYTEKRRVIDGEGHLRHMTGCRLLHVNGTTLLKSPVILKAALMYRCTALIPSIAKKNKHIYSFKLVKKKIIYFLPIAFILQTATVNFTIP